MTATSERGGAVSVQLALLWSALLVILLAGVQVSLVAISSQLALTAAEDGLRSGRYAAVRTPSASAQAAALQFIQTHADGLISDPSVEAEENAGVLTVRVSGQVTGLLPDLGLTVDRTASAAIERPAG
ncbi:hypothetical protein [Pseudonocardia xishanensis]|uniref:TadE-like protein n=1 Tax=Pseudonocardia xishanensis TaxID=630995 RepID=A0ABP8RU99_9PSEU